MQNINLPIGYKPPLDLTADPEANTYILEAGYKLYQMNIKYYELLNAARNTIKNDEAIELYKTKINKINEQHVSEINELNEKIKRVTLTADEEARRSNEYAQNIQRLQISILDREKELRSALEKEHQLTLNLERERYHQLCAQHTALTAAVRPAPTHPQPAPPPVMGASALGALGEEVIERWCRELFNSAEITNRSHIAAKGDLLLSINNKLLILEVKNKLNIQRSDIDKFIRDIEENKSEIHAGLFISLNSASIPNKGDYSLEYVGDIPVLYMHIPDRMALKIAIKTLLYLNCKTDNTLLTMSINHIYKNLKSISSVAVSLSKNCDDQRINLESMKREIKNGLQELDALFNELPDIKYETSTTALDYRTDEIATLLVTYSNNKKAKMDDYAKALGVTAKYLQDRGGAARIKTIVKGG